MTNEQGYKVSIYGDQYTLKSDESGERVIQAAALVDSMMKEMAGATRLDTKKLAVLAALRLADKLLATQEDAQKQQALCCEHLVNLIDQELLALGISSSPEHSRSA